MPSPTSEDLRKRIKQAVEAGSSCRAAARRFSISESCVIKLMQRWRKTGTLAPGQMGGWKDYALAPHEGRVRALVAGQADLTLDELRDQLGREGIRVGRTSIWRFLAALGLTLKKRHSMPPSRAGRTSRRPARLGADGRRP